MLSHCTYFEKPLYRKSSLPAFQTARRSNQEMVNDSGYFSKQQKGLKIQTSTNPNSVLCKDDLS